MSVVILCILCHSQCSLWLTSVAYWRMDMIKRGRALHGYVSDQFFFPTALPSTSLHAPHLAQHRVQLRYLKRPRPPRVVTNYIHVLQYQGESYAPDIIQCVPCSLPSSFANAVLSFFSSWTSSPMSAQTLFLDNTYLAARSTQCSIL